MTRFSVIHLPLDRIEETLPLARMADPALTTERWRRFARILDKCSGGTLAALDVEGRTHGLAAYWVDESLVYGRVLRVEPMVTFEISASAPVRAELCEALELLAQARSCESLVISTGSRGYAAGDGGKLGGWARLGLDLAAVSLVKRLPPRSTAGPTSASH